MRRLFEFVDNFSVRPQPRHFAAATPLERDKLLRYIRIYLRECEKQDARIPMHRRRVGD
jgi:hypothetical protein